MDRLFQCDYAERVVDQTYKPLRCWYVPHYGVASVNQPNKVRLAFDAASKSDFTSLNDLLLPGPDLLRTLIGVFIRFRQYVYAITADMKDMFTRLNIILEDRNAQRFLWRR